MYFGTGDILDDFSGFTGPLEANSADWTTMYGAILGEFEVGAGVDYASVESLEVADAAGNLWVSETYNLTSDRIEAYVTILSPQTAATGLFGIVCYNTTGAVAVSGYVVGIEIGAGAGGVDQAYVQRVSEGVPGAHLDTYDFTCEAGDKIGFQWTNGDTITCFLDTGSGWVEVSSWTDPSPLTDTTMYIGPVAQNDDVVEIDDWSTTADYDKSFSAGKQSISLSQHAATVAAIQYVTVTAAKQSLVFDQHAATVAATAGDITVDADKQSMALEQHAATVTAIQSATMSAATQSLALGQHAATVTGVQVATVEASSQSLTLNQHAVTVSTQVGTTVSAALQSLALNQHAPAVSAGQYQTIDAGKQSLALNQHAATASIGQDATVSAGVQSLTLNQHAPTVLNIAWRLASSLNVTLPDAQPLGHLKTHFDDGVELEVGEQTGIPGFDFDFTFGEHYAVTETKLVANFKAWYDGNPAHNVKLQQYNFNTTSWVNVTAAAQDFPDAASEQTYKFNLIDDADYLDGGLIKLRIIHTSSGNLTHTMYIDHLYLSEADALIEAALQSLVLNQHAPVVLSSGDQEHAAALQNLALSQKAPLFVGASIEDFYLGIKNI